MNEKMFWEGKYKFTVKDSKTKKIIREDIIFNRILDTALREMGKCLYDSSNDCIVNYLALGTETASILNTATSLGSETFRTYKVESASTISNTGEVSNTFDILSDEAKFHIREVGIIMGSTASATVSTGQLMSIISWDYDKTDKDVEIQVNRYDSFNRSTKDRSASEYVEVDSTVSEDTSSYTKDVNFIVPAYFYPSYLGSDWDTLTTLATTYGNRIKAIANPGSGPGASQNSDYVTAIDDFRSAGGEVYGYVASTYGTKSTATIESEIDDWISWYNVDGFFIDEMANTTGKEDYYKEVYNYIKAESTSYIMIGNPGSETIEGYLYYDGGSVSDILCCFENSTDYSTWENTSWTDSYDSSHFYSIMHGCATSSVAESYIDHAIIANCKNIYITDDVMPNPFDVLSTYFSDLLEYCNF